MAGRGIAVLRFDFTGLGSSDGDFANTNFSSNVQDLLAAARALENDYQAPALLIGHSLGGAAILAAAPQLASVEAVVHIAAPATADPTAGQDVSVDWESRYKGVMTVLNQKNAELEQTRADAGTAASTIEQMQRDTEALRAEMFPTGIDVLLVSPATVETEIWSQMIENTGDTSWRASRGATPDFVAERTVRAIRRGRREVFPGWYAKIVNLINRMFPSVVAWVMERRH